MAMEINSVYGNYAGTYTNQKETKQIKDLRSTSEATKTESTSYSVGKTKQNDNKTELKAKGTQDVRNKEYLHSLNERFSNMDFKVGNGISYKNEGNSNLFSFSVSPKLLEKMQSSPEEEKKYIQQLKDIESATKWLSGYMNGVGMECEWSNSYIDENGELHHAARYVRKSALSDEQKEEIKKRYEERIEKTRENAREKAEQILEKLEEKASEKDILDFDEKDLKSIIDVIRNTGEDKNNTTGTYVDLQV